MNLRPMLAKAHIARKDLGLDEETYRDVVKRITGQTSARDCTPLQLDRLIAEFRRLGWKPKTKRPASKSPRVRKVWALWGAMCKAGLVKAEDTASRRAALRTFVEKMTGVADPEWLSPQQASNVIEGLKAWQRRGVPS
jgi:phage gp16-like protein